jgi:hypothetical protein
MIIDSAAGGVTKRRCDVTFPLLTLHRGKDRVHFFTGLFPKRFFIRITDEILRTTLLSSTTKQLMVPWNSKAGCVILNWALLVLTW